MKKTAPPTRTQRSVRERPLSLIAPQVYRDLDVCDLAISDFPEALGWPTLAGFARVGPSEIRNDLERLGPDSYVRRRLAREVAIRINVEWCLGRNAQPADSPVFNLRKSDVRAEIDLGKHRQQSCHAGPPHEYQFQQAVVELRTGRDAHSVSVGIGIGKGAHQGWLRNAVGHALLIFKFHRDPLRTK